MLSDDSAEISWAEEVGQPVGGGRGEEGRGWSVASSKGRSSAAQWSPGDQVREARTLKGQHVCNGKREKEKAERTVVREAQEEEVWCA